MAITRSKAFELQEDGLQLNSGAHISSGVGVPTHAADDGDWYIRKISPTELYAREGGVWVSKPFSAGAAASGNKGWIQYRGTTAGSFDANVSLEWDENKQSLLVGEAPEPSLADILATFTKTTNSYSQIVKQNKSSGNAASSDIVAANNLGTDTQNFIDMGIVGSNYGFPDSSPNEGYVYVNGGPFSLGTETAHDTYIFTGGFLAAQERARFVHNATPKDAYLNLSTHLKLLADTTANRPTTPQNGMLRYNTTTLKFEFYQNGSWVNYITNVLTTKGDIFVFDGTNIIRLPVGTNEQVLKADSATASGLKWATEAAGGGSGELAHYLNFGDKTGPGNESNSSTYALEGYFAYRGTAVTIGRVVAKVDSGATGQIRFYNVTQAETVMESATFSNTSYGSVSMGTLVNQPAFDDLIEVQLRRATGSGNSKAYIATSVLYTT